jgi:hypothetical protein
MEPTTDQQPNPIREATIQFLATQQYRGFKPEWMITFHYANPEERGWNNSRRLPSTGKSRDASAPLLLNSPSTQGIARARNDFFEVSQDAQHIRNLVRRAIWEVKRNDKIDESETPMIFFHEKGGETIQFHTHLLLGETPPKFKTKEAIEQAWREHVIPKAQCLSRSNSVHIEVVEGIGAIGYLTKEMQFRSEVVDYEASCLFKDRTPCELIMIHKQKRKEWQLKEVLLKTGDEEAWYDPILVDHY